MLSQEKISIEKAYNSEEFKSNGYKMVDILADYLQKAGNQELESVLPPVSPDEMMEEWDDNFPEEGTQDFTELAKKDYRPLKSPSPPEIRRTPGNFTPATWGYMLFYECFA